MTIAQGSDKVSDAGHPGGAGRPTIAERLHITKRSVQITLGVIWIIDAGLQFQPKMFGSDFVAMVIAPNASGQPGAVGSSITHMANFLSHDVPLWNTLFGLTQLAIGVALLRRRTVKAGLVVSFAWAFGVWWFGEGFGSILTGHASALTGAPGAVVLYAVIGALVWPRAAEERAHAKNAGADADDRVRDREARTGLASSAAGHGPLAGLSALWVWAGIWVFFAVLQLSPQNRTSGWLSSALSGAADGQPGWYAHVLNSLGHASTGAGTPAAVILAALFLVIGLGPFLTRRPDVFVGMGMALAALFWVTGQAVGGIMTGMGTDPNAGPLLVLLGAAFLPLVHDPADAPVPAAAVFGRHQRWATLGVAALAVVPAAVAAIPETPVATASASSVTAAKAPASANASMNMNGMSMNGMNGMPANSSKPGAGAPMNMSAMAGLGVTDPNWKYTGPPLSALETTILTVVGSETDAGHAMQTPNCTASPTPAQVLGAVQYVQATSAAVAKYKDLSAATAAGYVPITSTAYPIVHYLNPAYMNAKDILDPNQVDSLVYAFTPNGPVLVAAMFLLPGKEPGPMPYGCLVQWHAHTNLCTSTTTHTIVGFTPCPPGTVHDGQRTPYMTHVWQVPVAGGPLAMDPSDLQVMQAAIMAQEEGLAPSSPPVSTTGVSQ